MQPFSSQATVFEHSNVRGIVITSGVSKRAQPLYSGLDLGVIEGPVACTDIIQDFARYFVNVDHRFHKDCITGLQAIEATMVRANKGTSIDAVC